MYLERSQESRLLCDLNLLGGRPGIAAAVLQLLNFLQP